MKLLLIDNVEASDTAFNDPLRHHLTDVATVTSINYHDTPTTDLVRRHKAVVISGAPLDYPNDVIDSRLPFFAWLKQIDLPILGICLGHQNLARLYGADMIVDQEAENGSFPLEVLQPDALLTGVRSGELVTQRHRVSVTVPADFQRLASTTSCRNQVMKHAARPTYGVQFHPELSPAGHTILRNFISLAANYSATPKPITTRAR